MPARAYTTPEVLRWARETAAISVPDAARRAQVKPEKLAAAEQGDDFLTLRQARLLAEAYGRSLATLFRREPPDEPSIEARFRRLRDAPPPPWSPELIKLERAIGERQDAAVDIYAALGDPPPWQEAADRLGVAQRLPGPDAVRELLGLQPPALRAHDRRDRWHSRRVVVRAVEWAGILVIRQPVPDQGVRGFLAPHPDVPAIFVNSRDDPRSQAFTVIHEFAHLLLATAGQQEPSEEAWCEQYAGELLMPDAEFRAQFRAYRSQSPIDLAIALGYQFGVTPLAAAVRARRLDLFGPGELDTVKNRRTEEPEPASGGDGNRNKVARLSPTFTDLVLAAAASSTITLAEASRLLRTRVDDFDKLRRAAAEALSEAE
jgi:Zn-dependent peptidase ImmA (M78 family)